MSIDGINGASPPLLQTNLRQTNSATDSGSNAVAVRSRAPQSAEQGDTSAPPEAASDANKPPPLRFPWLSRLSTQLAAASRTPTTFSAPVLGDNVDKQA